MDPSSNRLVLQGADLGFDRGVRTKLRTTTDQGVVTPSNVSPIDMSNYKPTLLTPVDGENYKLEWVGVNGQQRTWEGVAPTEDDDLPYINSMTWRNGANDVFWGNRFGTGGTVEINGAVVATTNFTDTQFWIATGVLDAAAGVDTPFDLTVTTSDGRKRTFNLSKPPPNGILSVRKLDSDNKLVLEGYGLGYDKGVAPTPCEWVEGGPQPLMTSAIDCDSHRVTTYAGMPLDTPVTIRFKTFTWTGSVSSTDTFTGPALDDVYWDVSGDVDFYGYQFGGAALVVKCYGKTLAIPGGVGPYFTIPAAEWGTGIVEDDQPLFLEMNNGVATTTFKLQRPTGGSTRSRQKFKSKKKST